jgi:hypothetical protein
VIVADPAPTPVTVGATVGPVALCAMNTLVVDNEILDESLGASVIDTPPAGAGDGSATESDTVCPTATLKLAGITIAAPVWPETTTFARAVPKFGVVAVIEVEPPPIPVTANVAVFEPGEKVTVAGGIATLVFAELMLAVRPLGAGADSVSVMFPVDPALTLSVPGDNELSPVPLTTCT